MATKWISPTWRMPDEQNQSKFENYSLDFDSAGPDHIFLVNSAQVGTDFSTIGNANSYSFSFWVNTTNSTSLGSPAWYSDVCILELRTETGSGTKAPFNIGMNGGKLFFGRTPNHTTSDQFFESTALINTGNWVHCAITIEVNTLKIYINNSLDSTHTFTVATGDCSVGSTTSNFIIASRTTNSGAPSAPFDGRIGHMSIFNYALSSTQINYLYNSGTPVNPMAISGNAPIAYYPLGGGSTGDAAISSPSTLTVPNESVADATVFDFDSSDYVSTPSILQNASKATFNVWINFDDASTSAIFGKGTATDFFSCYTWSNGYLYFWMKDGGVAGEGVVNPFKNATALVNAGDWNMLTVVFDGTQTGNDRLKIYLNSGASNIITNYSGTIPATLANTSDDFLIGSAPNATTTSNSKLSNFQIWNTALTNAEVATLYNYGSPLSGTQPQAANLRAWYKMNVDTSNWDGSDWVIGDSVSQFATAYSIPNTNNDNNVSPYGGNSKLISGGSFLSVADSILAPSASVLSISCWVKLDNPDVNFYDNIISQVNGATAHSFRIMKWRNNGTGNWTFGTINFALYSNDTTAVDVNVDKAQFTPQANTWFNIICTYDGTTMRVFINNKLCGSGTSMSGDFAGNTNNRFIIGKNANSIYGGLQGAVSNVQVWNSTLTGGDGLSVGDQGVGEIAQLYNNGTPLASSIPQASSLLGWWKLESDLNDYSGNNKTLTAYGNEGGNANSISPVPSAISSLVSILNGTSFGMTTTNLVNSDLTRSIPYSSYSMSFDGAAEEIRCGNSLGSSLSQADYVTVSCWVYFNDITDEQGLWSFRSGDNTNDTATSLSLYDSGATLRLAYYEGGNNGRVTISNPGFSNENWYNIVCVYDKGAAGKIYINGQAQTVVDSGVYSTVDFSSDNFYIGSYYSSTYATNGNLSNIAVWNLELTSDQVLTVYNGGVPNDISSLSPIRWWSLSGDSYFDGNNFICPNLTSSSNNGTSYNLGSTDLIGNGPGSTANGIATSMNIPENLQGNAPNSTKNAFSINMTETDRVSGTGNVPPTIS